MGVSVQFFSHIPLQWWDLKFHSLKILRHQNFNLRVDWIQTIFVIPSGQLFLLVLYQICLLWLSICSLTNPRDPVDPKIYLDRNLLRILLFYYSFCPSNVHRYFFQVILFRGFDPISISSHIIWSESPGFSLAYLDHSHGGTLLSPELSLFYLFRFQAALRLLCLWWKIWWEILPQKGPLCELKKWCHTSQIWDCNWTWLASKFTFRAIYL